MYKINATTDRIRGSCLCVSKTIEFSIKMDRVEDGLGGLFNFLGFFKSFNSFGIQDFVTGVRRCGCGG